MVGLAFVVGDRLIPWLLDRIAATRSRELFTLTVLVVALGIAVLSTRVFGVSMALGAFLAGLIVGRSEFSLRAATEALPMRDAFAVLFFVSIGSLFNPRDVVSSAGPILATLGVILVGKPLAALAIVLGMGYPRRTALAVSVALAQIGEFSFILAAAGKSLGVLDDQAGNVLIAASIVSITLNPILYRAIDRLNSKLARRSVPGVTDDTRPAQAEASGMRVVVVGHGPVGGTLARLLRENEVEILVIEMNVDTVRRLSNEGVKAVYGDATIRETLVHAEVPDALALILSSSSMHGSRETIRIARELNPDIIILARSVYLHEVPELREAGADVVFTGEGEVALSMTEFLMRELGATPEQIERERARVQSELFQGTRSGKGAASSRQLSKRFHDGPSRTSTTSTPHE
jgi:CPA2 family monovalent cation:H+ antiporter-2